MGSRLEFTDRYKVYKAALAWSSPLPFSPSLLLGAFWRSIVESGGMEHEQVVQGPNTRAANTRWTPRAKRVVLAVHLHTGSITCYCRNF